MMRKIWEQIKNKHLPQKYTKVWQKKKYILTLSTIGKKYINLINNLLIFFVWKQK